MEQSGLADNPYLLLTPGPLSTTKTVKQAMLRDWCTWDEDYNKIIRKLRDDLVLLATKQDKEYTAVLMQGSGTFAVESVIGSVIPGRGRLLVAANGAYGDRIAEIADVLGISHIKLDSGELAPVDFDELEETLAADPDITHVAVVHCETTTGMLNDIERVGRCAKKYGKIFIVDAMSSFGGIPMDIAELEIDYLISSANKCIQGVPGFGFVIARISELNQCGENARSLSLNLYDQWQVMETGKGKWRFTSPTHVVRAFVQAMQELADEGGVEGRYRRYLANQKRLTAGMGALGFWPLLDESHQSPFITAFLYPDKAGFTFGQFYEALKQSGFVIYPGKVSKADTFRIGNIGDVHEQDIMNLLAAVRKYLQIWNVY